jgi:hypothetical protein
VLYQAHHLELPSQACAKGIVLLSREQKSRAESERNGGAVSFALIPTSGLLGAREGGTALGRQTLIEGVIGSLRIIETLVWSR